MQALSSADIFLFKGFRLDPRGLFRGEKDAVAAPVEIGSRALDVLRALVERPGVLLSRHEIMASAWPRLVVDDNNLTIQMATLRRSLDPGRRARQLHRDGARSRLPLYCTGDADQAFGSTATPCAAPVDRRAAVQQPQ